MPSNETFEDGMPKFDDNAREIVRLADSSMASGWRYTYKDTMGEKDKEWKAGSKPAASSVVSSVLSSDVPTSLAETSTSLSSVNSGWGNPAQ